MTTASLQARVDIRMNQSINVGIHLSHKREIITLVGANQAKKGYSFIHQGSNPRCEDCKYYQVCIKNLQAGRVYTVIHVREKSFPCEIHENDVRVVEVIESDVLTILSPKLAIEGAIIVFQKQECDNQSCEHYEQCIPYGLIEGDRCKILAVKEKVVCLKGLPLFKVLLHRD